VPPYGLSRLLNLAVVAKSDPDRIRNFARERGWRHLRLLSSRSNAYNRDYHAETPEGEQMPILNVFVRDGDQFRHAWASELMYAPRDEGMEARHFDSIWPIWNVLDVTPEGRGTDSSFPALRYDRAARMQNSRFGSSMRTPPFAPRGQPRPSERAPCKARKARITLAIAFASETVLGRTSAMATKQSSPACWGRVWWRGHGWWPA
jgi:hypothetical protein